MAQPGPAPSCHCRGWRGRGGGGGGRDRRRREVDGGQGLGRSELDRQEVPGSGRALGSKSREGWRAASAAYLWCPGGAAAARPCSSPRGRDPNPYSGHPTSPASADPPGETETEIAEAAALFGLSQSLLSVTTASREDRKTAPRRSAQIPES